MRHSDLKGWICCSVLQSMKFLLWMRLITTRTVCEKCLVVDPLYECWPDNETWPCSEIFFMLFHEYIFFHAWSSLGAPRAGGQREYAFTPAEAQHRKLKSLTLPVLKLVQCVLKKDATVRTVSQGISETEPAAFEWVI